MFILIWVTVLFAVGRNNAEERQINTHINTTAEQGRSSNLTSKASADLNYAKVTCKVILTGTVTLNVTSNTDKNNAMATQQQTNSTEHPNTTSKENVTSPLNIHSTKELGTVTTLTKKDNSNTTSEGVSSNKNGDEDLKMMLLRLVKQPEIICAFLTGVLLTTILSTIICCLMSKCHRKKQKTYENLPDNLEMLISQTGPLMDDFQEVVYNQINDQEAAKAGGAEAAGKSDVDYSTIKFSALKRQARVEISGETTETEYAEIKREKTEEEQDGEGNQEAVLIEEVEETNHDIPEEGEGEDVVLHSDVKDIVSEIQELAVDVA